MSKSKDNTKNIPKHIPLDKKLVEQEYRDSQECKQAEKELKALDTANKAFDKRVFKWITTTNPAGVQTSIHNVFNFANFHKVVEPNQQKLNQLKQAFDRATLKAEKDEKLKGFVKENRKTIHNNTINNNESIKLDTPKERKGGINKIVIDITKDKDGNFKTSEEMAKESPKKIQELKNLLNEYWIDVELIKEENKKKIEERQAKETAPA